MFIYLNQVCTNGLTKLIVVNTKHIIKIEPLIKGDDDEPLATIHLSTKVSINVVERFESLANLLFTRTV